MKNFKRPMNDVLIDIETLGTKQDCVIVSVGAIIFNRADEPGTIIDEFEVYLDVTNQTGRVADPSTMLWWMRDDMEEARKKAFKPGGRKRLGLGLKMLDEFISGHEVNECWGCGPSFDMSILEHAYGQHKQPFPIPFWKWSCVRTIESFFYGKNTRKGGGENHIGGTAHDALDDCRMEALVIQKSYNAVMRALS